MATGSLQHRELSILVGVLFGTLLAVPASSSPLTSFGVTDLVLYISIPTLAAGLATLGDPENRASNGALVGAVSGVVYITMEILRLTGSLLVTLDLFLALTVPIWALLGVGAATFIHTVIVSQPRKPRASNKVCGSCKTTNPPDASYCKNCGTKLAE